LSLQSPQITARLPDGAFRRVQVSAPSLWRSSRHAPIVARRLLRSSRHSKMVRWLSWATILMGTNHRATSRAQIRTCANRRETFWAPFPAFLNRAAASRATICAGQNAPASRLARVLARQNAKSKRSTFRIVFRFEFVFLATPLGAIKERFHQFALSWKCCAQHAVGFFQGRPDAQPGLQFRISSRSFRRFGHIQGIACRQALGAIHSPRARSERSRLSASSARSTRSKNHPNHPGTQSSQSSGALISPINLVPGSCHAPM
jgi:hypothetical protein